MILSHFVKQFTCMCLRAQLAISDSDPMDCSLQRLRCPWNFPGKNTGVDYHFLLKRIFPTQGSNPHLLCLLRWQAGSLPLVPPGKPVINTINLI